MKANSDLIRINKYLAMCNICSRRQAEELIKNSKVKINGSIETDLARLIDTKKASIEVEGKSVEIKTKNIYIVMNKPKNYIVTKKDEFNRKTVFSLLPDFGSNLIAVGRLDSQTEGMLILTDNGEFAQQIIHPQNKIPKTYKVTCKGLLTKVAIEQLRSGVKIDGKMKLPCKIFVKERKENYTVLKMVIYESRNRQIRKMITSVGSEVVNLKRLQIGNFKLGKIPVGMWRFLNNRDITQIIDNR